MGTGGFLITILTTFAMLEISIFKRCFVKIREKKKKFDHIQHPFLI